MSAASLKNIPAPRRIMAPIMYPGGKGNLTKWIISYLDHIGASKRVYCEPFSGAASIFFHKRPHPVEVLNDIDEELVNLFRVLQDRRKFKELFHRLVWTPYSFAEFKRAVALVKSGDGDEIDRAWAYYVAHNQGVSGLFGSSWSKAFTSRRNCALNVSRWRVRWKMLNWWHNRLTMAQIDCRDALEVIQYWDSRATVFYLDPPYISETRRTKDIYRDNELDDDYHRKLVDVLLRIKGAALLSGYEHPIYEQLLANGWNIVRRPTVCHMVVRSRKSGLQGSGNVMKKHARVECLYISPTEDYVS